VAQGNTCAKFLGKDEKPDSWECYSWKTKRAGNSDVILTVQISKVTNGIHWRTNKQTNKFLKLKMAENSNKIAESKDGKLL
jgi:hypothetical protein